MRCFDRDEVVGIEFVRSFEEDAVLVLRFAFGRERGPGGVLRGEIEMMLVIRFGGEPLLNFGSEAEFSERFKQDGGEFGGDGVTIEGAGGFLGVTSEGFALDEFAFDREDGSELVMAVAELIEFGGVAEEFTDEVFYMRSEFDDEFGSGLIVGGGRIFASGLQPAVQFGRAFLQLVKEERVEFEQTRALIEV